MKGLTTAKRYTAVLSPRSSVVAANTKRPNIVRVQIPISVRDALDLQAGDEIEWEILSESNMVIAKVRKVKE